MAPPRRSSLFGDDDQNQDDLLSSSSSSSSLSNHQDLRNNRRRSSLTQENNGSAEIWRDELELCLITKTNDAAKSTLPEEDPLLLASTSSFHCDENALFSTSAAAEAEACKHDAAIAALLAADAGACSVLLNRVNNHNRGNKNNNPPKERTKDQQRMDAIGMTAVLMGWLIVGILMVSHFLA